MALMIGKKKEALPPTPPIEEPLPEEPLPEEVPEELPEEAPEEEGPDPEMNIAIVAPDIAGYRGPEMGPFFCGNCQHYGVAGPNTCEIVSGKIEQEGLCNLFNSVDEHQPDMPEEEEVPTDDLEEPPIEPEIPEEDVA